MSDEIQAWPLKIEQRASILDLICAYCLGSAFFSANKPIAQMTSPIPECVETFSRSTRFGRSCLWQTDTSGAGSMSAPKLVASIRPDHVTAWRHKKHSLSLGRGMGNLQSTPVWQTTTSLVSRLSNEGNNGRCRDHFPPTHVSSSEDSFWCPRKYRGFKPQTYLLIPFTRCAVAN